jgi:hypothetical protein
LGHPGLDDDAQRPVSAAAGELYSDPRIDM